jgi:GNAT superfamily N-acetyltransferase
MGLQPVSDATLVRHAYVRPEYQGRGISGALLTKKLSLCKDSPTSRAIETFGRICPVPILGGLHHRQDLIADRERQTSRFEEGTVDSAFGAPLSFRVHQEEDKTAALPKNDGGAGYIREER